MASFSSSPIGCEADCTLKKLKNIAKKKFGILVKAVVDVEKQIMAIDGELHADEEALLIESGLKQASLWGINIYPDEDDEDFIEFDSVINLRPTAGNLTREIDDIETREKIEEVVNKLIKK